MYGIKYLANSPRSSANTNPCSLYDIFDDNLTKMRLYLTDDTLDLGFSLAIICALFAHLRFHNLKKSHGVK